MSDISSIGKFHILATLGRGAHSTILQVRRDEDGKTYALKVVTLDEAEDQKFLAQAEHELKVARLLDHPALVKVYALELVKDWLFRVKKAHLLLEYVNGKTLDTCPPLRPAQLVQVFERVAQALVHMHRRGVYHGDLKPNNVMVARGGGVKVLDFGLARLRGEATDRIQGTPEYIAPETAKHKMVNERTDIYNFGATMYRMLTYRLPPATIAAEGGLTLDAKTWRKLLKPVEEFNAGCPPALAELVHRCLSYDARARPERVSEIQGALDKLADDLAEGPDDALEAVAW